jgi:hypothetical protein
MLELLTKLYFFVLILFASPSLFLIAIRLSAELSFRLTFLLMLFTSYSMLLLLMISKSSGKTFFSPFLNFEDPLPATELLFCLYVLLQMRLF